MPKYALVIQNLGESARVELLKNEIAYIGSRPAARDMGLLKDKTELPIEIQDSSGTLSGEHGKLYYDGEKLYYMDLNSTNGTYIKEGSAISAEMPILMRGGLELILGTNVRLKIEEIPEVKYAEPSSLPSTKPKIAVTTRVPLKKPEGKPLIQLRSSDLDAALRQVRFKPR